MTWPWVVLILGLLTAFIALTALSAMHNRETEALEKWDQHRLIELGIAGQAISEQRSREDER